MLNNIKIDESLLQEALEFGDQLTVNLAIESALREYIKRHKHLKMLDLFGTIDYEEDYDYKQQRQRR